MAAKKLRQNIKEWDLEKKKASNEEVNVNWLMTVTCGDDEQWLWSSYSHHTII